MTHESFLINYISEHGKTKDRESAKYWQNEYSAEVYLECKHQEVTCQI